MALSSIAPMQITVGIEPVTEPKSTPARLEIDRRGALPESTKATVGEVDASIQTIIDRLGEKVQWKWTLEHGWQLISNGYQQAELRSDLVEVRRLLRNLR